MTTRTRHDFTERTKRQIAQRAGYVCSDPNCPRLTVGATLDGDGEINIGVAAHICAASPGGPRYDPNMSEDERRSASNGIWMCQIHAKAIDSKDSKFTVEVLHDWKERAQAEARRRVLYGPTSGRAKPETTADDRELFFDWIRNDLSAYKRTNKWPASDIELKMSLASDDTAITTSSLAAGLSITGDLVIIADPGQGKTSALFQIAEACLRDRGTLPLFVSLPDWALQPNSILSYLLQRAAFQDATLPQIRKMIREVPTFLLLDGWNELDAAGKRRARSQLDALQSEEPELGLVVATRRQRMNVPISGMTATVLPLDRNQQYAIAEAIRGMDGRDLIDRANRQQGIRSLVTVPLYLSAILSLPDEMAFPSTKEALLRQFARQHEEDPDNADALLQALQTSAAPYLRALAIYMTRERVSAVDETQARMILTRASGKLVDDGQIGAAPEPRTVLDVIVDHHLLVRFDGAATYSFQHQQFQEWYASYAVSEAMRLAQQSAEDRYALQSDFLDRFEWEESIMFACERLASGGDADAKTCSQAILAALEVDPLLAAQMIRRSTDDVWADICDPVTKTFLKWHTLGTVDRAFGAMMMTGRQEFSVHTWPLLSHEDDQVHLKALRQSTPLSLDSFEPDLSAKVTRLDTRVRRNVLHEMAMYGDFEVVEFATELAKSDPDPEVAVAVLDALDFRRADSQLARLLQGADDTVYDRAVKRHLDLKIDDPAIQAEIEAARTRLEAKTDGVYDRMHALVFAPAEDERPNDVRALIFEMDMSDKKDSALRLIYEIHKRYPKAVALGVLDRLIDGRSVFWRAGDILWTSSIVSDESKLLETVLAPASDMDSAEAAASALGPASVGKLLDALNAVEAKRRAETGKRDSELSDRSHLLRRRIAHVPGRSLIQAIASRSEGASLAELGGYSDLVRSHLDGEDDRGRPFGPEEQQLIGQLFQDWSQRALDDPDIHRHTFGEIAGMAARAPFDEHLPRLQAMLDRNLYRFNQARAEAARVKWRRGFYPEDARHPHLHHYQWVFAAFDTPKSRALMADYLLDPHFGECAARILLQSWKERNEPRESRWFSSGLDVELINVRREAVAARPQDICEEAGRFIEVVKTLLAKGGEPELKHATMLTRFAVRLPYGNNGEVVEKVLEHTAPLAKVGIFQGLLLSGRRVATADLIEGVEAVLEEAKEKTYLLTQSDGYALREWLDTIPFSAEPETALETVMTLPERCRSPRRLESMLQGLGQSPEPTAEVLLFSIAEREPEFYASGPWRRAAFQQPSRDAATRLIELALEGRLRPRAKGLDRLSENLSGLFHTYSDLRSIALAQVTSHPNKPGADCLLRALAMTPDLETVGYLLDRELETRKRYISRRGLEDMVTSSAPSETWRGAHEILPVSAPGLRAMMLAATRDCGKDDIAATWLKELEEIWDRTGWPESELRHPDITSGKPWPIPAG